MWLNISTVSLEELYAFTVHFNIFIMRTDPAKNLFQRKKNVRGQAENNAKKLSVEISSVSSHLTYRVIAEGAQVLSVVI